MKIKINLETTNERIDQVISSNFEITRSKVKKLIDQNKVFCNGEKISKSGIKISGINELEVLLEEQANNLVPWNKPNLIDIIDETSNYLIINKHSGLTVHPGNGNPDKTLVNILLSLNIPLSQLDTNRPGIVHRLDKNTSGLMIIAKTNKFHYYIQDQFIERKIIKKYLGLVVGNLENIHGMIEAPIGRDPHNRKRMTVTTKNSKNAITYFNVKKRFRNFDLVEFEITTGRTHQIRVHAQYIKHPIYNDPIYGIKNIDQNENLDFGQYLYAKYIAFTDLSGEKKEYEAPLPLVFKQKLTKLEEYN